MRSYPSLTAIALALAAAGCGGEEYKFYGVPLEPVATAPLEPLVRDDSTRFAIGAQRGRASLVFFGYTNCPDICPTTLADWKRVKTALGTAANYVNFVFVTIDPETDTPAVVERYLAQFDTAFVGLTGGADEIAAIAQAFGVTAFAQDTLPSGHAAMVHPSRVYLVDPRGRVRFAYPPGLKPEEIAEDVRHVL